MDGTVSSTFCDSWNCTNTFTILAAGRGWGINGFATGAGAKLGPAGVLNNQANLAGRTWDIMYASNGIRLQQGSPALSFETHAEADDWVIAETQDHKTWKIQRTQN